MKCGNRDQKNIAGCQGTAIEKQITDKANVLFEMKINIYTDKHVFLCFVFFNILNFFAEALIVDP